MREEGLSKIASAAVEAMLYEVSATPKPGLVDRNNCGVHTDMDFFTFMASASALHDYFDELAQIGREYAYLPADELLDLFRDCGKRAETRMFSSTGGVNTHKGMLFSLGLLVGCAGWYMDKGSFRAEVLCSLTAKMCRGICDRELGGIKKRNDLTKGEKMYLRYGCTGARGEAESGYATVRRYSLPIYRKLREEHTPVNESLVQCLLYLMSGTPDTNIISRHNIETAQYVRKQAASAISLGGILSGEGRKYIEQMDRDFIEKNISPGGCADLLAVTHFLYAVEKIKF